MFLKGKMCFLGKILPLLENGSLRWVVNGTKLMVTMQEEGGWLSSLFHHSTTFAKILSTERKRDPKMSLAKFGDKV